MVYISIERLIMKIHIEIPDDIHKKLKIIKNVEGKSFNYIVVKLLTQYFKNRLSISPISSPALIQDTKVKIHRAINKQKQ